MLGSIFFAAAGTSLANGADLPAALGDGAAAMQRHGGASLGDRTMLDALLPAVDALRSGTPADAARAADVGAAATAAMTSAAAGRSAYVSQEHLSGVQDPGAAAVAVIFRAAAAAADEA